jgi:hypothetical protein
VEENSTNADQDSVLRNNDKESITWEEMPVDVLPYSPGTD